MIIGLCGAIGSGKNAAGRHLTERYGAVETSYAAPLYAAVSAITGMSVAELQDRDQKERNLSWLPVSPRRLLQTLGTEWGRQTIHPEIWVLSTFRWIEKSEAPLVVITDVRFPNEAEAVRARGGVVWRVNRPGNPMSQPAPKVGLMACIKLWLLFGVFPKGHPSEAGIPNHLVDDEILNDGDLATLARRLDEAMARLQSDIMR